MTTAGMRRVWNRGRAALLPLVVAVISAAVAGAALAALPAGIQQTVMLVVKRNPESGSYVSIGTAFHVGGGWLRTAAHVVETPLPKRYEGKGFDEWAVYLADEFGNPHSLLGRFEVSCVDRRWKGKDEETPLPHDSALLKLLASPVPAARLTTSKTLPAVRDRVSLWGFPEGLVLFESRATITSVSSEWIGLRQAVGTPAIGGHSGSPVVGGAGTVIGIFVGGIFGVGERGVAVPIVDAEAGCPVP